MVLLSAPLPVSTALMVPFCKAKFPLEESVPF